MFNRLKRMPLWNCFPESHISLHEEFLLTIEFADAVYTKQFGLSGVICKNLFTRSSDRAKIYFSLVQTSLCTTEKISDVLAQYFSAVQTRPCTAEKNGRSPFETPYLYDCFLSLRSFSLIR